MKRVLAQEIVGCLRVSGSPDANVARLRTFTRADWELALPWLDSSGLALYFWHHQKEIGADSVLPPEIKSRLARNLKDNHARVAQMAEECGLLNRFFEDAGVDYALLKGFAMIPDYCPGASLRTQYDYDYLVRPRSLRRADQALRAAGYLRKDHKEEYPALYFQPAHPPLLSLRQDDLYSAHLCRSVELHVKLWEGEREQICFALPEDLLDRAFMRTSHGLRFFALADEDALIFQVLHTLRHILNNWCRLSIFYEIAHFLQNRSSDHVLWERFRARIEDRPGLPLAAGVVFSLTASLFGVEIPAAIKSWTTQALTPALALWVERYGRDSALENFRGDKFSLFLHREFVQDLSAWRDIRRRRLFPFQRPHRAVRASSQRFSSRLTAAWKQRVYAFRRVRFHLGAALRYAWELPRWQRMVCQRSVALSVREAKRDAPPVTTVSDLQRNS